MQNKNKRFQLFGALLLLMIILFVGMSFRSNALNAIWLESGSLEQGYTIKLGTVCYNGNHGRTWYTSDSGIAEITGYTSSGSDTNKYCSLYLHGCEYVTITCNCACGESRTYSFTPTKRFYFDGTSTNRAWVTLRCWQSTGQYNTYLSGSDAHRTWATSNSNVAYVSSTANSSGGERGKYAVITAGGTPGTATITATIGDGSNLYYRKCYIYVTVKPNVVYIAYNRNGGSVGNGYTTDGNWVSNGSSVWFHSLNQNTSGDPYNASTFGLSRTGYTFGGWQVHSTGSVLNQDTSYSAATYAQYNNSGANTNNTNDVYCYLYAVWNINSYTLDVNPKLDGTTYGSGISGCTFDVYVNGTRVANDVIDYCASHTYGSTYEVKDFKTPAGKTYTGSSSYSGTIGTSGAAVSPTWTTNTYSLDVNPKLDGTTYGSGITGCTFDVYINGTRVSNDVIDYCTSHPYGTTYEIKDFKSPAGKNYTGSASYSGTITAAKSVEPTWATNYVRMAYHPNGGTYNASGYADNGYGFIAKNGTTYFHTISHGSSDDPYNASTFGLTRAGYTFGGWKVKSTGSVLGQDTSYAATTYAHHDNSSATTANTSVVSCYLYAVWNPVKVTGITISGTNWCYIGETTQLTATIAPSAVADGSVTWSSSATGTATVNSSGKVTGVKAGTVTITATANDGSGVKGTYSVTVKPKVTGITISGNLSCYIGKSEKLTATISPSGVAGVTLSWSSNSTCVELSATTGTSITVTGKSKGSATITCTANGTGVSTPVTFTVLRKVDSISVSSTQDWCWVGETLQLSASVSPSSANNKNYTWSTSSKAIATVSSSGLVTGVKAGEVTITATANDGQGGYGQKKIYVRQQINGLTISGTNWCWVGKTSKLTATIAPSGGVYNSTLKWSSSNESIAKVSSTGVVTGQAKGTCKIYVESTDGKGAKDDFDFEVRQQVVTIELTGTNWCWVGKTRQLTAKITTKDPYNSKLNWSSNATGVATVNSSGVVTGVAKGTAVISVDADDGQGGHAEMSFTVKQQVTSLEITGTLACWPGQTSQLTAKISQTVTPTDSSVSWKSSDSTIASIDSKGKVTANKPGTVTITCTANDGFGKSATATFLVWEPVSSISISGTNWCYVGNTRTLTATCSPENAYNKAVTWSSSNTTVATVSSSGVVTGKAAGTVTITATAKDGQGAKKTYSMTIYNKISGVVMSKTSIDLFVGGTNYSSLSAYTEPTTGTRNSQVLWSSSDTTLVTVSGGQNYKTNSNTAITLVPNASKLGSTTIVAKANDDNTKTNSTTVNLYGFKLNASNITMFVGGTYTLNALKTTSSNTTGTAYSNTTWKISSGSTNVSLNATSGNSVIVTAKAAGTAKITATASAGNTATATCTITIRDFVLKSNVTEIFAPRSGVSNAETATLSVEYDDSITVSVKWSVISGSSYVSLNKTTGDSVVLTPKSTNGAKTLTVKVRATTTNGDANVSKDITLTVKQPIDTITLGKDKIIMFTDTTYTFNSNSMSPSYAYNPNWTWTKPSTSKLTISQVDTNAHGVTIKADSNVTSGATITATANDGRGATDSVTVEVRKLFLNASSVTMYLNSSFTLNSYYTTSTDANKKAQSVAWSITSGSDIVSISSTSGTSTVVSAGSKTGTATIKATATQDTSKSVSCTITVKEIVLSLTKDVLYVKNDDTASASYTGTATASVGGTNVSVNWTSSNASLVSITSAGAMTGLSTGSKTSNTVTITATIPATATSAEGKVSKTVTIRQQVTGAAIQDSAGNAKTSLKIYEGANYTLKAVATPSYAYNNKLNWSITGTSGVIKLSATTTSSGGTVTVTGLKAGTATIQVKSNDGYVTKVLAECNVRVYGLELKASSTSVWASRTVATNPETVTLYSYVDGTQASVTWSIVSGSSYASLSTTTGSKITVTPKTITAATQTIKIKGTTTDGDANISKEITITLKNPVNTITLGKSTITMYTNTSYTLTASIDNTAYNTKLNWTVPSGLTGEVSSDTHSVKLTAGSTASAGLIVTATAQDGRGATASAKVIIKKLYLSATKVTLYPGATYTLSCLTTTSNDAIKSSLCTTTAATWSITSGSDFVTLSTTSGGSTVVTATKAGTATIKAVPNDNNASAKSITCTIVVEPLTLTIPNSYIFVKQSSTVASKYQSQATATATTSLNLTWSSSDTSVATVSTSGLITGISTKSAKSATVTITATAKPKIETSISDYSQTYKSGKVSKTIEIRQQVTGATIQDSAGTTKTSLKIYEGATYTLKAVATPSYAYNNKLNWSITGTSGVIGLSATTTSSGGTVTVTGLKAGTATIQVKANDGVVTNVLAECNVRVYGLELNASSTSVWASRTVVTNPETFTITSLIDGTAASVKWSVVSGSEYVTLSATTGSKITVTPKTIPTATKTVTIRGTTTDGDSNIYKEVTITLKNPVNSISVADTSIIMYTNTTLTVNASINSTAYNSKLTWASSSPAITVSSDTHSIVITAGSKASSGNTITATANDGRGAKVTLTVDIRAFKLSASAVTMTPGSKYTLTSLYTFSNSNTVNYSDCTKKSVTWSITSGSDVISLSSTFGNNTVITALKAGTATVKAVASDNTSTSATCTITVNDIAVSFDKNLLYVKGSESAAASYRTQAYVKMNGSAITGKWTSSNAAIAEVHSQTGVVTGISTNNAKSATATITASVTPVITSSINSFPHATVDGTASKTIEIRQQVTGATIQEKNGTVRTSIVIYEDTTMTLKAVATPSYAYNTRLNWTAIGDAIALSHADSASGEEITLTGVAPGTGKIQVTANDGIATIVLAECSVTVRGLKLTTSSESIFASRVVVTNPETATLSAYIDNQPATSVTWAIISGGEYATLSSNTGATVTLTPKTIPTKTQVVKIRATTTDGDINTSKEITITLKNPVNEISLSKTSLILFTNTTYDVNATINETAYNPSLTWKSPSSVGLTVSNNTHSIKITAGSGAASAQNITVTANDGRGATASVSVAVKKLYLSNDAVLMYPGSTFDLSAFYTYSTTANGKAQNVVWDITSGSDVISLSATSGSKTTISASKAGTATIKATATENTSTSVTCTITVKNIAVSFDKSILYVKNGDTKTTDYQMNAYAKVDNQNVAVTWKSSNTALATIDASTGKITAISTNGKKSTTVTFTATIAATSNSAEGKQTGTIEIRQQVTDATIQNTAGVEKTTLVLYEGESYDLKAITIPSYAYNTKLNWKVVGTDNVISISKTTTDSGEIVNVMGWNAGTATIQITSNDGLVTKVIAECSVRVKKLELSASSNSIWASRVVVTNPETTTLSAFADGSAVSVKWSIISGGSYATLSSDTGSKITLTPKTITNKTETVTIRATTTDGDTNTYKDISITLKNPVNSLALNDSSVVMYTNTSYTVNATISNNPYNNKLSWTKPSGVTTTVSSNTHSIVIKAGNNPSAAETITVTAQDGRGATTSLTVAVKKLYLSNSTVLMYPGSKFDLSAFYTYSTTANGKAQNVAWSITSGSDVISLSTASGSKTTISAAKAGTATIKATATDDTSTSVTCTITVKDIVLSFDKSVLYVKNGDTKASDYQTNAYAKVDGVNQVVTWKSSNTALATIDANTGLITAISTNGKASTTVTFTATIAATSNSAEGKQTGTITIRQQVTDAIIQTTEGVEKTDLVIYEGETYKLKAIAVPSYAYNTKLNWSIAGSPDVIQLSATTTNTGDIVTVTGLNAGRATIQITSNDGYVSKVIAECNVQVKGFGIKASAYEIFASRIVVTNPDVITLSAFVDNVSAPAKWEVISGGEFVTLSSNTGATVTLTPKTITNPTETVVIRGTTLDGDANTYKEMTVTLKNPVNSISLDDYTIIMYTNTSYDVHAAISNNAYNKKLDWSKPSISSITASADTYTVTIKAGSTPTSGETITVTANDGRGATNSMRVIIRKLLLSADDVYMTPGSSFKLSAMYTYDNGNYKIGNCTALNVNWKIISGDDVVKLSSGSGENIAVTGLKTGTAIVQATTIDGDTVTTATCSITVKDIAVSFDQSIIYVKENYSIASKYQTVAHATINGNEVSAVWQSGNSALATINENTGAIVGISTNGAKSVSVTMHAYVTPKIISSVAGYVQVTTPGTQTNNITVRQQVTGATIQNTSNEKKTSLVIYEGTTYTLKAVATPSYAYNNKLNWSITGTSGVIGLSTTTTSSGGTVTVTGLKAGTATIQIKSNDGIVTKVLATCSVKVQKLELSTSSNSIWASRIVVTNPETATLSAFIDGVAGEVKWSVVSGSSYVTLSSNVGSKIVLTPKTITNQTETIVIRGTTTDADTNTYKELTITLKNPVNSISLNDSNVVMYTNTSYQINATISNNPYNNKLSWTKPSGVTTTVSSNTHSIVIKAGSNPSAAETITVTAQDGRGAKTSLTVAVKKLYLSNSTVLMYPGSTFDLSAFYTYSTTANGKAQNVAWAITSGSDVISLSTASGSKTTISAAKAGTATIKATATDDTSTSVTCTITVKDIVIAFDKSVLYVKNNDTKASDYQTNAYAKVDGVKQVVTWKSSNTALATIDANTGLITAISTNGQKSITVTFTATIAATSNSAEGKQTGTITIKQQVADAVIRNTTGSVKTSLVVYAGESYNLQAQALPSYAYNTKLNWSIVGDKDVISLSKTVSNSNETVTVTGLKAGTAKIQIKSNDGIVTKVLAECAITVKEFDLSIERFVVYAGSDYTLKAYSTIYDTVDQQVTWSISDSNIATLDKTTGNAVKVHGVAMGTATITARTTDADANTTLTCQVEVKEIRLEVDKNLIYVQHPLTPEDSYTVYATIYVNKVPTPCVWTVSDKNSLQITVGATNVVANAEIVGLDSGKPSVIATITATSTDATDEFANGSDYQTIEIRQQAYDIYPSQDLVIMYVNTSFDMSTTIGPDYIYRRDTVWEVVSGKDIVQITTKMPVEDNGKVTLKALKAGNATIKISAADGQGAYKTIDVVVKELTFSHTDITIFKGDSFVLTSLVNGNPETVKWTVEDENIVSVVSNRGSSLLLKAENLGSTTIRAESIGADTNVKISTTITVMEMYVEAPVTKLYVGEQLTLTAFVNGKQETVTWTSSNSNIATVGQDKNGTVVVTAVASGNVEIIAESIGYTQNGKISTGIKVLQHVTDIQLNKQDVVLYVGGTCPINITIAPENADTNTFIAELDDYSIIAGFSDTNNPFVKNLTGNKVGVKTFHITANDRFAATATGTVTVKDLIIPEEIVVGLGSTYSLTAYSFMPTLNAEVKQSVTWRVEGSNISINKTSGDTIQITGKTIGNAKLYATTTDADGNVTKVCNVRVSEYVIHADSNVLYTGETMTAYVAVNGSKVACTWASSDETIATVQSNGTSATITAISAGKATISATASNGDVLEVSVEVKQAVESITLDRAEIVIYGRDKHSFTAIINPETATDMNIIVTHTDSSIMLLSSSANGNVVNFEIAPLKTGEDTITLTAADGKGATASIRVVIKDIDMDVENNSVIYVGETVTVNALLSGANTTVTETVNWSIGNSSIATLDKTNGLSVNVTGKAVGETTLTATTASGDINKSISRSIVVKQAVQTITLDKSAITLAVNSSATLNVISVLPATASDKSVTWMSSDPNVVKVHPSGNSATIVASQVGTATITVVANDGKGASASCVVTVESKDLEVTGLTMYVDSQTTVSFNTDLLVGWDGLATWTTSSDSVVKILSTDKNTATLKAISAGNAVVTAKTAYHNGTATGTHVFNITVKDRLPIPANLTLYKGTTYTLSTGGVDVSWKSEHVGYVMCGSDFGSSTTIQAVNAGTTKVVATIVTADATVSYACTVTVKDINISCSKYNLWIGETATLSALSGSVVNENVVWTIDNDNISIDKTAGANITLKALKAGSTVVTATTTDGDANTSTSITVNVQQPVTKLTMKSALTVYVGSTAQLTVVAMPSTATNTNVNWTVSDDSIISIETKSQKISSYATITGLKAGTTTITATAADGKGAKATCTVTVIQRVESITVPKTCIVYVGKTATLTCEVLPTYAENTTVEWISSNPAIATVNATTGLVKGVSAGEVTITCKATDGSGVSASCKVTVMQFVTNITLEQTEIDMYTNYANTVSTAQLNIAQISPVNASNTAVKWESDKPEYITVDENGLLTVQVSELPNGLTYETVTITCSALDGSGVRAKCTVTLKQHASEVFIIDYEQFFVVSNGMITGLTDYAYDKLKTPNININIPSVIGGQTIVEISDGVFANCENIVAVTIPSSVMYISDTAFENCDNIADIYIMSNRNKVTGVPWGAKNATIHWLDMTDDESTATELTITASNRHLIGYTGVKNEELVIPEYFYDANGVYYKVVAIGTSAFADCTKLTKVVLPNSVTKIEASAFSGCSGLKEITLSENISSVGDYAFKNCSALTTISFSENIKTIGENAFNGCAALKTIMIDRYYNEVLYGPWGATNATIVWKTPV